MTAFLHDPHPVVIIAVRGGSSSTGRAPDCGSGRCGFDSHLPPHPLARHQSNNVPVENVFLVLMVISNSRGRRTDNHHEKRHVGTELRHTGHSTRKTEFSPTI